MRALLPLAAITGMALFATCVWGFGAALPGYSQALHPVSLLGATDVPRGGAFNLMAFVLPGVIAALVAMDLRRRLPGGSSWWSRLGAQLLLLSALALVGMGLLPLDLQDLESDAGRLHGTAWMAWAVAFAAGALAFAIGLRRRNVAARLAWVSVAAAVSMLLAAFVMTDVLGAGAAQRLAFAVWLGWFALAARPAALALRR